MTAESDWKMTFGVGANVTVLDGVTIGTGSVASAGAVVTKSVSPKAISMGVPAKIVKMRDGASLRKYHHDNNHPKGERFQALNKSGVMDL